MSEIAVERATPINSDKLEQELAAGAGGYTDGFHTGPGIIYVITTRDLTAPEIQNVIAIVTNHIAAGGTEGQNGRDALAAVLNNNADLLKYADYFFSRSTALSAQWKQQPLETDLTILATATVAIMEGNRASDVNHQAMWVRFRWKLQMKYNFTAGTGSLPALSAAQARQLLIEADAFIDWGVLRVYMILLRNLI